MVFRATRHDQNVTKFYQKPEARINGQYLRQVSVRPLPLWSQSTHSKEPKMWFSGSHSDVGGGFQDHGLSDLALVWMVVSF